MSCKATPRFPLTAVVHKPVLHKLLAALLGASVLLIATLPSSGIIDAALQMQLGNPSGATADTNNHDHYLIQRPIEALDYSDNLGQPNWASWDLTAADIGNSGRTDAWAPDTDLPPGFYQVPINAYSGSGYDRGHLCPSADRTDSTTNNALTFLMSNIMPQAPLQNQNIWANFENYCRQTLLPGNNELLIICGPGGFGTNKLSSNNRIAIPAYTWKVVVVVPSGTGAATNRITPTTQVLALKIPNTDEVAYDPWQSYVTNAAAVEAATGLTFFTALPPNLATVLRNKVNGQTPPPPAIADFMPTAGPVNTSVSIAGTNFVFATNVTFNGISAAFAIDSSTNIIALVPADATPGPIAVATLGGTATTMGNYTVSSSNCFDLAILKTHTGNFTHGGAGSFVITVTNTGTADSSGTVTVTDLLPAGLTATAMGGAGWTADLGSLTCARSDALTAGAGYPPITIDVSVAADAPAGVTNLAIVFADNDANTANNMAADPTIITPAGGEAITLAAWDVSSLPGGASNFGPSPLAPSTKDSRLTVVGLTRGSGVGTNGTGAQRAWGGNNWTNTAAASAIASNRFATFSVTATAGYSVSFASISKFDYRRSATGPTNGLLQYQIGAGSFNDIATLSYPSSTSAGGSLDPVDLTGIADLQNVGPGTNVTFRLVNWGGTSSAGTWYVFDVANTAAPDLLIEGRVSPVVVTAPDLAVALTHASSFTQGDTHAAYSITITNMGAADTAGTVGVTATLPSGLTALALAGAGWTADLDTTTCTRTDALAAGGAYPPITLTVSVATNAPPSVISTATVFGGGECNFANNTASDPTTIIALAPIQLWRLHWYGTTANSGPAADTALAPNGMPNLLAYALGLNPTVPADNPVVGDIDTGYLRLTVPRNPDATDISFCVEVTGDLTTPAWTTNGTTVDINTPTLLQAHENTPVSASPGGFIRLRVTNP